MNWNTKNFALPSNSSVSLPQQKTELLRVLLVEDNLADATYVEQLLPATQYSLQHVASLAAAKEYISTNSATVILLDLSLPDGHGLDTFRQMNAIAPQTPILVLTGFDDQETSILAVKLGAQDYVLKQHLTEHNLSQSIRYAIERKQFEESIRESAVQAREAEAALKHALEASQTGVWSYNPSTGVVVLDDQATSMFGGDAKVGQLQEFIALIHADDRARVMQAVATAISEQSKYEIAFRTTSSDGSVRHILAKGNVYSDSRNNSTLTGVCIDLTERNLSEQERIQLVSIVESTNDGIISKDLEGVILSWNQAAERIFGYCAAEMIGKNISELMPNHGVEEFPRIMENLRHGQNLDHLETVRVRKDGALIDVSLTLSPITDRSGTVTGAAAIVRDISKRKRSERVLSAQYAVTKFLSESDSLSEAAPRILQLLAETLGWDLGEIWCIDKDESVLKCFALWHKPILGIENIAALSRHISLPIAVGLPGAVWSQGEPIWIEQLGSCRNFPQTKLIEKTGLCSAVGFPILRGPDVLGVITFFCREVRETDKELVSMFSSIGAQIGQFMGRKFSEQMALQAMKAEQGIARAILEHAPIGIARLNKNLVITEANGVFCEQFYLPATEVLGKFIFALPLEIPSERLVAVVEQGVPFRSDNFRVVFADSLRHSERFFDLAIWPAKDDDSLTASVILLTVDVTERVKLAKQREDFVATLTHDLKNPLIGQNRMLGLMLQEKLGLLHGEQASMLTLLKEGTTEMLDLIGTLLEVYRYEDGAPRLELEVLDAARLINGCIAQMTATAEVKGVTMTARFAQTLDALQCDKMALRRVLMNLLDNAIKFTDARGTIQVAAESTETHFVISVEDSGSGISTEELQTLFQRFVQTGSGRRLKAGTGLGLYLCRQIVEAHGGNISCSSIEGVGTTMTVTLPTHV